MRRVGGISPRQDRDAVDFRHRAFVPHERSLREHNDFKSAAQGVSRRARAASSPVGDVSFLRHLGLVDLQGIFHVSRGENGRLHLSDAELESRERLASPLAGPLQERPRVTEGRDDAMPPH
jgi:hypothetical protein